MNIHELEKLATPRPWRVAEDHMHATGLINNDGHKALLEDNWPEDMQLAAHCRNNFMRALEALQDAHTFVCRFDEMDDGEVSFAKELSDLITELEEVQ